MHLVEILLPVVDNENFPGTAADLKRELVAKFGGVTAFMRAPGEGVWDSGSKVVIDRIVVIEVMTDHLDRDWWSDLRSRIEGRLGQDEIVIRAHAIEQV